MTTEVWFRDPHLYVKELVEVGAGNIAWNRGLVSKRRIDPVQLCELYYGKSIPFRNLLVGNQGTAEIGPGRDLTRPLAVYPTWQYGDEPAFLEDMLADPVGKDMKACFDASTPPDERPVFGQEHRVVITEVPVLSTNRGRAFVRWLKQLQEDYPEAIVHLHGVYSFKYAFGMGFGAADMECRTSAAKGRVQLASGIELDYKKVQQKANWVTAMGMTPGDLEVPRMRCIFNIKSAIWAGENYNKMFNQRLRPTQQVDSESPDSKYEIPTTIRALPVLAKAKEGDKTLCNMCSLQLDCKQFRAGEVCSLTDGNTSELARFFQTRDSRSIIDGLGVLMAMQTRRLESAAAEEQALDDLSPEVTKMINALFSQGVTLAKLIDPSLRGGGVKVNVGVVNGTATAISATTPQEMTSSVIRALEQQGIPRDKITPELIMATINGMQSPADRQRAIEGAVISEQD